MKISKEKVQINVIEAKLNKKLVGEEVQCFIIRDMKKPKTPAWFTYWVDNQYNIDM